MNPEPGVIPEDAFGDIWEPQVAPSGDLWTFDEVQHLDPRFVWTVTESGDVNQSLYAVPGFHIINVVGYLTTTRPAVGDEMAYWFFDDRDTYVAELADGTEVEEVGEDEQDARERIEDAWDRRVVRIWREP